MQNVGLSITLLRVVVVAVVIIQEHWKEKFWFVRGLIAKYM
jgi:hypothetical protein